MEEERNLLDYAYVLVKWRRLIVLSVVAVSLATAGVSLVLPEKWTADTLLLAHEEELGRFELSMLLASAAPGNLGGLLGRGTPGERLVTLLESRRVLGALVDRFGLLEEYGAANRDLAMEELNQSVEKELGRDGTLKLQVEASSPQLAADLANAFAAELDRVIRQRQRHQASQLRLFLEERMRLVQGHIEKNALDLQRFQEEYGVVDLEAQTKALVGVIQGIVQELTLQEVKLGVARRQLHADHEERRLLEMEVEELRRQLRVALGEMEGRAGQEAASALETLGPPLPELPRLGLEYARLALNLKIDEQVLTFLAAQLEDAKYKEALDTPTIQVLDPATPPQYRSAPRRTLMVLVAACASLVMSAVLAFACESASRLGTQNQDKLEAIRRLWQEG